ncbi:MAG: hypothetical protein DWQ06_06145 [Calditrichaeota bacterium]|nr:MAG: hypothetical protein DWQ06_06145 [Calditrichota bacterium]
MKKSLIFVWVLFAVNLCFAKQDFETYKEATLELKSELKAADSAWKESLFISANAKAERILGVTPSDHLFLTHYYIGYINWRLGIVVRGEDTDENKDKAGEYFKKAQEHLEKSIEFKEDFAESRLLLSSVYGNRIGLNAFLGMFLGSKASSEINQALELDSDNPRVHLEFARNQFFTPKMFGGSLERALEAFSTSIEKFKTYKIKNELYPEWGNSEVHTWYGIALMKNEENEEALEEFNKTLELHPENGWVKYNLIPQVQEKISEAKAK